MKISISTFLFFSIAPLCALSAKIEPQIIDDQINLAQESPQKLDTNDALQNQQLSALYGDFIEEATQLNLLIELLAGLVSQTNMVRPEERSKTLEWLQEARYKSQNLLQTKLPQLTQDRLTRLIFQLSILISLVDLSAQSSFSKQPRLEFDASTMTNLSLNKLEQLITINRVSIARIEEVAKANGLSRINIGYRKISQFIHNYKIPTILATTGTAFAIGTIFFILLDEKDLKNSKLKHTHKKINSTMKSLNKKLFPLFTNAEKAIEIISAIGLIGLFKNVFKKADKQLRGDEILNTHSDHEYVSDVSLNDPCFDYIRPLLSPFYRIAEFLANPAQFAFTGLKNCQALLLVAPPGYGKSFTARAAAGLFNQSAGRTAFISIGTAELIKQMQKNYNAIQSIIENARENAPCVIWIDELHLLGGGLQIDKNSFILQEMLKVLDLLNKNADPQKMVFVVGATNRPDLLDNALLRHGRFSQIITLPQPTHQDRISLIHSLCKQSAIDPSFIDAEYIAQLTPGVSPSTLSALFEHANFLAKRENKCLNTQHLYESINTIIRNIQPHTPYNDEEKQLIATRIAGEALYYFITNQNKVLDAATIRPIKEEIEEKYDWMTKMPSEQKNLFQFASGMVFTIEEPTRPLSKEKIKAKTAQLIATKLMKKSVTTADLQKSRKKNFSALMEHHAQGLPLADVSKKQREIFKELAYQELITIENEVEHLLKNHTDKLICIRDLLIEKEFLLAEEIQKALN